MREGKRANLENNFGRAAQDSIGAGAGVVAFDNGEVFYFSRRQCFLSLLLLLSSPLSERHVSNRAPEQREEGPLAINRSPGGASIPCLARPGGLIRCFILRLWWIQSIAPSFSLLRSAANCKVRYDSKLSHTPVCLFRDQLCCGGGEEQRSSHLRG